MIGNILRNFMVHRLTGHRIRIPTATSVTLPHIFRPFHSSPVLLYAAKPKLGDTATTSRTFTLSDIQQFAVLSGDTNSLHTGEEKPSSNEQSESVSPSKEKSSLPGEYNRPIAHGILTLGVFSAIMGTQLPGEGTVMHGLDVKFPAPLYVGEEFTARVEVIELKKRFATMSLLCTVGEGGKVVVKGTARVFMPREQ